MKTLMENWNRFINESTGRPVLAVFKIEKAEPKIPGAEVGDVVVLNTEVDGQDGKKYGRYSVYYKGQKVSFTDAGGNKRVLSVPDDVSAGLGQSALTGGTTGESYIVDMDVLKQHPGAHA